MTQKSALTICTLAWHESMHLGPCFMSLARLRKLTGAETLIVLNSDGDQETEQVALRVADRVIKCDFVNFSIQRNYALDDATGEWVFFIDADERCTPQLAAEIAEVISNPSCAAYRVPRRNILFRREIRHTGWWPDYQVRLLNKNLCRYNPERHVHEFPIVQGETGTLFSPMLHYNYATWSEFFKKQRSYARLDAAARLSEGHEVRIRSFIGGPAREFVRRYVSLEGYKDGYMGLLLALAMSAYQVEVLRQMRRIAKRAAIE